MRTRTLEWYDAQIAQLLMKLQDLHVGQKRLLNVHKGRERRRLAKMGIHYGQGRDDSVGDVLVAGNGMGDNGVAAASSGMAAPEI